MNVTQTSVTQKSPVVKVTQDKVNLARSKGEYAPKWTRNVSGILAKQAPKLRSRDDDLLWA